MSYFIQTPRSGRVGQVDVHQADADHQRGGLRRAGPQGVRRAGVPEHCDVTAQPHRRHGDAGDRVPGRKQLRWFRLIFKINSKITNNDKFC